MFMYPRTYTQAGQPAPSPQVGTMQREDTLHVMKASIVSAVEDKLRRKYQLFNDKSEVQLPIIILLSILNFCFWQFLGQFIANNWNMTQHAVTQLLTTEKTARNTSVIFSIKYNNQNFHHGIHCI